MYLLTAPRKCCRLDPTLSSPSEPEVTQDRGLWAGRTASQHWPTPVSQSPYVLPLDGTASCALCLNKTHSIKSSSIYNTRTTIG